MNAVFLSYFFPPLEAPRAVQVNRLAKFSKLDLRVFTSVEGQSPRPGVEVVRFPDNPAKWWKSLRRGFYLPDQHLFWAGKVARQAAKQSMIGRDDVLVTFGQPMSDHLAGLALKKKIGMPWIAHFSDPWADNPYHPPLPFAARAHRAMEKKVVAAADRVLFTSANTVDLVMAKYPKEWMSKASVLPHAYDPELMTPGPAATKADGLIIRYLGNFYGQRNPRCFADALKLILADKPKLLDGIRFELVGRWVGQADPLAAMLGLPDHVLGFTKSVNYLGSLDLMASADALLILDAPFEHSVFFPSKLVDYLGSGRPIIAATPEGTTKEVVSQAGGTLLHPSDPRQMAEGLVKALAELREGNLPCPDPDYVKQFRGEMVAAQFDDLVRSLAG